MKLGFVLGALAVSLSCAAPAGAVTRYVEYDEVHYKVDFGADCALDMNAAKDSLNLQWVLCIDHPFPSLAQEMSALSGILEAMKRDHHDLRNFKGMMFGELHWPQWRERLIDCSVAKFGPDDRAEHETDIYRGCHIFPELNAVLAPYGVYAVIGGMEESSDIDFRKLGHVDWGLSKEWLARHSGYRGKARFDGLTYLQFVPINRH